MKRISIGQKIALIIFGLFLCVVLLEIGLRIGGFVFLSLREYRNIISIKKKGAYCVMCLGESTTAHGGDSSYPRQLEEVLNQRNLGIKFSVINKGRDGTNTGVIVSQLENDLNKYTPDMVITMMGINDGRDTVAYEDILIKKVKLFLNSFRTYKLVKLLKLHIVNKTRELVIYKSKRDIAIQVNDLTPLNDKEVLTKEPIEINHRAYYAELERPYIELGVYYNTQREFAKAEEILKKAIEINPENYKAHLELGMCYKYQGTYAKAEEIFKKAIEINPRRVQAYFELGVYYKEQRKFDKAEGVYKKIIEMYKKDLETNPDNHKACGFLAYCYEELGKHKLAEEYLKKANSIRLKYYNPITRHNYQKLEEILTKRGIKLVCVQYPVRSIEPLKRMLENAEGIIFVDNEAVFKEMLRQASYDEYFTDVFGGDFDHCTAKGNRLLAENIADVILRECFNK